MQVIVFVDVVRCCCSLCVVGGWLPLVVVACYVVCRVLLFVRWLLIVVCWLFGVRCLLCVVCLFVNVSIVNCLFAVFCFLFCVCVRACCLWMVVDCCLL